MGLPERLGAPNVHCSSRTSQHRLPTREIFVTAPRRALAPEQLRRLRPEQWGHVRKGKVDGRQVRSTHSLFSHTRVALFIRVIHIVRQK